MHLFMCSECQLFSVLVLSVQTIRIKVFNTPPKGEVIPVASFHMATKKREESTSRISWNTLATQREEEEEQLKAEI